ncbi:hypothetical protein VE25_18020 [Devosia geojensis]|uniref:Uncharacterized protein n=1 Tax=Devosia geojensis TaxID=443610 RepID=A0A0F5FPD2_9HYPH|nr:hypothetical protein [Devosia geojensis]KKB10445.1 hypothetical protein VE25_18020 [Devosia geojensis]
MTGKVVPFHRRGSVYLATRTERRFEGYPRFAKAFGPIGGVDTAGVDALAESTPQTERSDDVHPVH